MWSWIVFGLLVSAGVMAATHYWLQRHMQQRALRALRWLEISLGTRGHVSGMRWLNDSQFEVSLKIADTIFQRAFVHVDLQPWPLAAALRRFRKMEEDTITFHSDLDLTPSFSMAFHNLRWFARSDKKLSTSAPGWQVGTCEPVVLTTKLEWEKDIANAIYTMLRNERKDNLNVVFRRTSPNLSATMPLDVLSPEQTEPFILLDLIGDIASGASLKKAS